MATARPFNTWDALKLLALALMLVDHAGVFFFPDELWMRAIGRSAAPIFLFLAGFAASYRLRWDLVALAVSLDIYNNIVAGHFQPMNILFTIICCRLILETRQAPESRIKKPFDWYILCLAWIVTTLLIQYGTLGLLFVLCGYMKRFAADYSVRQRKLFWSLTFLAYGVIMAVSSNFSLLEVLLMAAFLIPTGLLLWRMEIRPVPASPIMAFAGKWIARHMAYIYAGHLALLMWLTGIPF